MTFLKSLDNVKEYLKAGSPDWAIRRRIVIGTLLFCGVMIIWAAGWMSLDKGTLIINQSYTLMTFVIGYYVFGPIVDDHMKRKAALADKTQTDIAIAAKLDAVGVSNADPLINVAKKPVPIPIIMPVVAKNMGG